MNSEAYEPSHKVEIRALLRIALPLAAAYLAEFAMFLTTKMVVGRLGYQELAAVGLASDITFELMVVFMGLLSIVGVLVAQAEGAGQLGQSGHVTRQGLVVAVLLAAPATWGVWHLSPVLLLLGQDPVVAEIADPYLHALAWSILPIYCFSVLRSFVAALARTGPIMVITVAAVGFNYVLTLVLVEGRFGAPALGAAGAGWSTTIVSWLMLLALITHIYRVPALRGYGLFLARLRLDLALCAEIIRLGIPIAALVLLEAGLFVAVSVLSGVLGVESLATYQVLAAWLGIPFVVALGIAEGTMVRVAFAIGRASPAAARCAGLIGMCIGVMISAAMVVVPIGFPELFVSVFLDPADPGYEFVVRIAVQLFAVVAVFQIFDSLQATASRALRGLKDTVAPLWIAGCGYWILGIGSGSLLAFPLGCAAVGLWWGMAAGMIVTGALLAVRFCTLTARLKEAGPAT